MAIGEIDKRPTDSMKDCREQYSHIPTFSYVTKS